MATVVYSRRAYADLDRLVDFALERSPAVAKAAVEVIAEAIELLENHPLIGRICEHELRELVISYGKNGYVALYDYEPINDLVVILAIRAQREAGYP